MKKLRVYIDMDNTIVNLDKEVIRIMNEELNMNYNYKDNKSWWWSSTGISKKYFENLLYRKGIFLTPEPIQGATEYISALHHEGFDIVFLTSPQWTGDCMIEKVEWLQKHFKWFDPNKHLIFTVRKELLANKNTILIDDGEHNLEKWNGNKICFATGTNKNLTGKMIRTDKWCEIYNYIKILNKDMEEK